MLLNVHADADPSAVTPWWTDRYVTARNEERFQLQLLDDNGSPLLHLCGLSRRQMEKLNSAVAAALAGDTTPAAEADRAHVSTAG